MRLGRWEHRSGNRRCRGVRRAPFSGQSPYRGISRESDSGSYFAWKELEGEKSGMSARDPAHSQLRWGAGKAGIDKLEALR